jgi:lysophospholipase L1-like esterase
VGTYAASTNGGVHYVDTSALINEGMVDEASFYMGDMHHLNDKGHALLATALRPALELALKLKGQSASPPD